MNVQMNLVLMLLSALTKKEVTCVNALQECQVCKNIIGAKLSLNFSPIGDPYKSGCNYVDPIRGRTECTSNNDCASNLFCHERSCISPCTNLLCGSNAFCEPENHAGELNFKKINVLKN